MEMISVLSFHSQHFKQSSYNKAKEIVICGCINMQNNIVY